MLGSIFVDLLIRMLAIVVISDLAAWWLIKRRLKNWTSIIIFIAVLEVVAVVINLWWVLVYK